MRRTLSLLAASVTALAASAMAVADARAAQGFAISYQTIPGDGGTPLKAFVVKPTGRGTGPFPLLVMPSSWSVFDVEYVGAAEKLATERGFEVVSYTSRGFWDSGGQVEVAGPRDTADESKVIDWAVAHAGADVRRVGLAGISYGAGISLLTAARDRRVKAVAAMSAWADLKASIYPNQTLTEQSAALLLLSGDLTGRPGKDLMRLQNAYFTDDFGPVLPLAAARGAAAYLDQINKNHPAILIGNAWEDGIFPPSQIADFYARLTGPKRLLLQPGDHGTTDLTGAAGLPNDTWAAAGRWFEHYLNGVDNGVGHEQPIQVKAANGGGWLGFPTWASLGPRTRTYFLTGSGSTSGSPAGGWTLAIGAGVPTVADSGIVEVTGTAQQFGAGWQTRISDVDRRYGAVWSTPPFSRATAIGGYPFLHTVVTPSAKDTSFFAYLYDVGPDGVGSLITHKPYTLRDVKPGRPETIDLRLEPIRWNLAGGHHLALVVDTMDIRYRSTSRPGTTVTFAAPSYLTVPTT